MAKISPRVREPPESMGHETSIKQYDDKMSPKQVRKSVSPITYNSQETNISNTESDNHRGEQEPLGYQRYLYDLDIEYSLGGNFAGSEGNKQSFRLKCLPYMIEGDQRLLNMVSDEGYADSISDNTHENNITPTNKLGLIDVTKTTCAFLSNSEYVPQVESKGNQVVLELISAKLSQSITNNFSANSSYTSLVDLAEQHSAGTLSYQESNGSLSNNMVDLQHVNDTRISFSPTTAPQTSTLSSKRFVNYTILIKTAPGLDKHPAVIERRFSDFLLLYQGLKSNERLAKIVDKHVTFPKKVFMGNFSATNIAERSIGFVRLLNLCMTQESLLWSNPFISFLLDKEIKEAHRLSLCGDPDDVQALIETAYYIERKLYLRETRSLSNNSPSPMNNPLEYSSRYSPTLPQGRDIIENASSNETISVESNQTNIQDSLGSDQGSSPNQSILDTNDEQNSLTMSKFGSSSLNQRLLVTFCMLFLTYYRAEQYIELKQAIREFNRLISSQEYVDSVIITNHYVTLRACLLFLMNLNRGDVIDGTLRFQLKQRLEDIDGIYADAEDTVDNSIQSNAESDILQRNQRSRRQSNNADHLLVGQSRANRITKSDLTSLLRDRNFCSFRERKYAR